jgi:hypothetical protein
LSLVTSDLSGNVEATQYWRGKAGVISRTAEKRRSLKKFLWFEG